MDGTLGRQTLDSFGFKNQANGKRLNPEMFCKGMNHTVCYNTKYYNLNGQTNIDVFGATFTIV